MPIKGWPLSPAPLTVATVYRTGGDYDLKYVRALRNEAHEWVGEEHVFACLTNDLIGVRALRGVETIPLCHSWPGWWAKFELFRAFQGRRTLYLDLDTQLTGPVRLNGVDGFKMRTPWRRRNVRPWDSGIMAWDQHARVARIYHAFARTCIGMGPPGERLNWKDRRGDAWWISQLAKKEHIRIGAVEKSIRGGQVRSYKLHCREIGGPPENTSIVCFHGKPRPREVQDEWVRRRWIGSDS